MPADPLAHRLTVRWLMTGAASACAASLGCAIAIELGWTPPVGIALGASAGFASCWTLAPRRSTLTLARDVRPLLAQYAAKLSAFASGDRRVAVSDLIQETEDDLGHLSRVVHDIIAEAASARLRSRLLHRQLDHSIERATKLATADLHRQAMTDALTGLGNRRALDQWLAEQFDESVGEQVVSVVAMDLDLFKQVNDTLGHEAGDRCLAFLGQLLRSNVRRSDCAIRLGGDEFAVILTNCNAEAARIMAVRVATLYQRMPWTTVEVPRPTLSAGFASATVQSADDVRVLLKKADKDLYRSKGERAGITTAVVRTDRTR